MMRPFLIGFILIGMLACLAVCEQDDDKQHHCRIILDTYSNCTDVYDNETMDCTSYSISSFDGAINYVRKIHLDIGSCKDGKNTSEFCTCLRNSTQYNIVSTFTYKWSFVFSNDKNFEIFKDLLNYTLGHLNESDVDRNNTDSIGFCKLYNWIPSNIIGIEGNKTKCFESIKKAIEPDTGRKYCEKKYWKDDSVKSFDNYVKCVYFSMPKDCDESFKKLFILEVALLKPDVFKGDILDYFKTINTTVSQSVQLKRKRLFLLGYYFFIFADKKNNYDKFCNITTNETLLFQNDYLTLHGYIDSFGDSKNYLSGVRAVVRISNNVYVYTANQTSFSENMVLNSNSIINGNNSDKNVDIDLINDNVFIFLKSQSTHVLVGRWLRNKTYFYHVFIRSISNFFSSSSGLLIDGCLQNGPKFNRFKRDTDYSSDCEASSADSDNATLFKDICVDACKEDKSSEPADMVQTVGDASKSIENTDVDTVLNASSGNHGSQLLTAKFEIHFCAILLTLFAIFIF